MEATKTLLGTAKQARAAAAADKAQAPLRGCVSGYEKVLKGLWRNGSASESRSEGWEFESLYPHLPMHVTHFHVHTPSGQMLHAILLVPTVYAKPSSKPSSSHCRLGLLFA